MQLKTHYEPIYEDQDKYWSSFDIGVSSCLVSQNFPLLNINRDNPKKVKFVFKRTKKLEATVDEYFADKLLLNPRTLLDSQKLLKNRIYSD